MPSRYAVAATLLTMGFAVPVSAAGSNDYAPKRTILEQSDVPGSNYTTILLVADIAPGQTVARHTHPGVEISYVLEGEGDFIIEGRGRQHVKAGQNFRLEAGVKHSVQNGPAAMKILAIYIVPKGAPLATPAPE
jgi:quercetin dioxygenase-like cupin family protein